MTSDLESKIIEWIESLAALTSEELPLFVQEVAHYGFVSSTCNAAILCLAFLFFACIAGGLLKKSYFIYRNLDAKKNFFEQPDPAPWAITAILPIGICMAIAIPIGIDINEAIKAKYAPKLYVIERFTKK